MTILDRMHAHLGGLGRRSVDVPEWGADGAPLTVWWSPITPTEHARIFGARGVDARTYVTVVQTKAVDAAGRRLFDGSDVERKAIMDGADLAVITRIANPIMAPFPAPGDAA